MIKKIYISGKLTDISPKIQEKNEKRFYEAQTFLQNYIPKAKIYNPVEIIKHWLITYHNDKPTYKQCLYQVMEHLWNCDAIYMLKDWEKSNGGAQAELALAKALNLKIMYENDLQAEL